jgi:hypothetical protein
MWQLISRLHIVIGELIETVCQRCPRIILRNKDDYLSNFIDKDIIPGEAEFLRKSYGLASATYEYFSGLHIESSCKIYIEIYIMLEGLSSIPADPNIWLSDMGHAELRIPTSPLAERRRFE